MGFISSNLALLSRFTSGQSDQLSVHKLYTWFPLRLFLFLRLTPPLHYQSIFHGPHSILYYRLPISLHSAANQVILSKSSKTPSLRSQAINYDRSLWTIFCPIFCYLIDANFPITGDQVLNCSMHHQKITSVSYSASNKAVFIFSTKLRNRLN